MKDQHDELLHATREMVAAMSPEEKERVIGLAEEALRGAPDQSVGRFYAASLAFWCGLVALLDEAVEDVALSEATKSGVNFDVINGGIN